MIPTRIQIKLIDSKSIKYNGEYAETLELHPESLLCYGCSEANEYDETLGMNILKKYDFAKVIYKNYITNILYGWDNVNEFYSLRIFQYDNQAELEFNFHDRAEGYKVLNRLTDWKGL